jgi:glutamate carboxypeptidase
MSMSGENQAFLEDLKALVSCQSPTEDLSAVKQVFELAQVIVNKNLGAIANADLRTHEGRPLLWWGSSKPSIILFAHLDTVWPIDSFLPLWDVRGDVIHAPGSFDMKCGFLQGVYAIKNLAQKISSESILNSIALIATSDEETGSFTTRELIKESSAGANAVLILESALDGKVKTARKGTAMYSIKVHGKASHAGLEPEKGINATVELAHLIIEVEKLSDLSLSTTVVPTVISGGSTTNTVPALASVEIDARSFSSDELLRVDREVRKLVPQNNEARIEITGGINRPPLEPSASKELFEILKNAASTRGLPLVEGVAVGGASDGNFAAAAGAHVIDGIGAIGGGAHAENEHVLASQIQPRIELIQAFLEDLIIAAPTLKNLKK